MLGASCSIADANTTLNTIVAEMLDRFSDRLEGATDFNAAVREIVTETYRDHKRILFDGNGYSEEWCEEAARRGLHNYATAAEAIPHLVDPENVAVFEKHGIFTEVELRCRCDIMLETVVKTVAIEANTMCDMARKDILPAIRAYADTLAEGLVRKLRLRIEDGATRALCARLVTLSAKITDREKALAAAIESATAVPTLADRALAFSRDVRAAMAALRAAVDEAEGIVAREAWPYPSYTDIFHYR
jgi:glutamine synthetase